MKIDRDEVVRAVRLQREYDPTNSRGDSLRYALDDLFSPRITLGGYPLIYINAKDGTSLCFSCARHEVVEERVTMESHIHWEGSPIECDWCGREIESAYGEVEHA